MASNTKVVSLEFDGIWKGMKILFVKYHFSSGVNGFHERIRAITDTSFAVGRLN